MARSSSGRFPPVRAVPPGIDNVQNGVSIASADWADYRPQVNLTQEGTASSWHIRGPVRPASKGGAGPKSSDSSKTPGSWVTGRSKEASARSRVSTDGADALLAIARRAASTPPDSRSPEPMKTSPCSGGLRDRARPVTSAEPATDPPPIAALPARLRTFPAQPRCTPALIGRVRQLVADNQSNVVNLGHWRRPSCWSWGEALELQSTTA